MITVLATNAYKAARKVYTPASKLPKPFNAFPVLACLKFGTHEGRATITGISWDDKTESLHGETEVIAARIEAEFETCIPARAFVDWLRVTQEKPTRKDPHALSDQITLSLDPATQRLTIRAGSARAEFKCIDYREFPPVL